MHKMFTQYGRCHLWRYTRNRNVTVLWKMWLLMLAVCGSLFHLRKKGRNWKWICEKLRIRNSISMSTLTDGCYVLLYDTFVPCLLFIYTYKGGVKWKKGILRITIFGISFIFRSESWTFIFFEEKNIYSETRHWRRKFYCAFIRSTYIYLGIMVVYECIVVAFASHEASRKSVGWKLWKEYYVNNNEVYRGSGEK